MKFKMSFEKVIKKEEMNKRRFREGGQREIKKIISKVYDNYRTIKEIIMNIPEGLFKIKDKKKFIQQAKCRKPNHWKETDGQIVLGVSNYL